MLIFIAGKMFTLPTLMSTTTSSPSVKTSRLTIAITKLWHQETPGFLPMIVPLYQELMFKTMLSSASSRKMMTLKTTSG
jgi:hypothetical protein